MKILNLLPIFVLASFVYAEPEKDASPSGEKPSILFILADDLTYGALGKSSDGVVKTPHLDQLKDQGCSFSYAMNSGSWTPAVCQASRTMLETGKTVWKAKKFNPKKDKESPLWSRMMKDAGYETYFTGKWHVAGITPRELFDHVGTVRGGMPKQSEDCYNRKFIPGKPDKWTPNEKSYGGYWEGGKHWSEVVADEACDFLKQAGKSDKPFFMYVAFNAPHDPRQTEQKYLKLYPVNKVDMPKAFLPEYPYNEEIGTGRKMRDERLCPFPRTEYAVKVNRGEYYSSVTHLDEQVGKILAEMKKQKKGPVYVIFTADQGLSLGDHGFMGKQNLYDASIRVPLFVVGPGIKPGLEFSRPIYLQSIMATCLQLAGAPVRKEIAYPGLWDAIKSGDPDMIPERDMYSSMFDKQRMILSGKWKMLVYPKAQIIRLYDRSTDPDEMKDLARDAQYAPVLRELYVKLKKLQKENDDAMNLAPVFEHFFSNKLNMKWDVPGAAKVAVL